MQPAPPTRSLFTPAIYAALLGLVGLAIVTVVVVVTKEEGSDTQAIAAETSTGSTSSAPPPPSSATSTSAPEADTTSTATSITGAFTFTLPEGYESADDVVGTNHPEASGYDVSTGAADQRESTLISASTSDAQLTMDEYVAAAHKLITEDYGTTAQDVTLAITDVDGDPLKAVESGEWVIDGVTVKSIIGLAVHDGTVYLFSLRAQPDNFAAGRDALVDFLDSITWI